MQWRTLPFLGCPECHGPLLAAEEGDTVNGGDILRCSRDGREFPVLDDVPCLVRPDRADDLRRFAGEYSAVWRRDGWGGSDPAYLLALPYRDKTRRASKRWKVKARSLDVLLSLVNRVSPRTAADLGCGVGWLSYHLARRGLNVYAVDPITDDFLGLGAAVAYLESGVVFHRIQGELSALPFQDSVLDLAVCNASLHYVPSLPETLAEVARALRPGGSFVVMNSPVHEDGTSARRAEADFRRHLRELGASEELAAAYHHFRRNELLSSLNAAIGPTQDVPFDPGRAFRIARSVKGRALRMELASFPVLWSRKARLPSGVPD